MFLTHILSKTMKLTNSVQSFVPYRILLHILKINGRQTLWSKNCPWGDCISQYPATFNHWSSLSEEYCICVWTFVSSHYLFASCCRLRVW